MSEHSQPMLFAETDLPSMSFAEGFRARTSVLREKVLALRGSAAAYGQNTPGSLANYDPLTSSWRTSQHCFIEGLTEYSETWPRSGMTLGGTAYPLPPLAPLTDATGYGLLPTPSARDWKGDVSGEATLLKRMEHPRGVCLEEFLRRQCLPTPSAGNSHSAGRLDEWGGKNPFRGTDIGRLHLNPSFVEEIMGFPIGHTDLKPSATPSCRKSPN